MMVPVSVTMSRRRRLWKKNVSRERPASSLSPASCLQVIFPPRMSGCPSEGSMSSPVEMIAASIWIAPSSNSVADMITRRCGHLIPRDFQLRSAAALSSYWPGLILALDSVSE